MVGDEDGMEDSGDIDYKQVHRVYPNGEFSMLSSTLIGVFFSASPCLLGVCSREYNRRRRGENEDVPCNH